MKYSYLENSILTQLKPAIRDVTPGVVVRAYHAGRLICDVGAGQTFPYYDLASLTKIIFTTQVMMKAFEEGKWNLDSKVNEFLPWFLNKKVTVMQLMNHSSGLTWWMPFYQHLDLSTSAQDRRQHLKTLLMEAPINEEQTQSVYSDVGFLLIGFLLEKFYEKDLFEIWQDLKNRFYLGTTLDFHKDNVPLFKVSHYAPTEECPWRKKLIQAEVHDENTWALGGISTHAGLFGSIDDLGWYLLNLRSQLLGIARYQIRQKTTQLFTRRSIPASQGDWALGFMMPTAGKASCGKYFSMESVGHLGFTGTSIWYDPKQDLGVLILSNRVLYGRENKEFLGLRPQIHDWIVEGFRRSGL